MMIFQMLVVLVSKETTMILEVIQMHYLFWIYKLIHVKRLSKTKELLPNVHTVTLIIITMLLDTIYNLRCDGNYTMLKS